jgi:hypothetical protein
MARLTSASVDYPQAVFTSFTKSLQNEWSFVQRVLLGFETGFSLIKEAIRNGFLPTFFSINLSEQEEIHCEGQHVLQDLVYLSQFKQHVGNMRTLELQQILSLSH